MDVSDLSQCGQSVTTNLYVVDMYTCSHAKVYVESACMIPCRSIYSLSVFIAPLRAKKILNLRLFEDPATGKAWDKSAQDLNLEVLCVSQVSIL